jgi:hypothetical protein
LTGERISSGTTGQRVDTQGTKLRFNTSTNLMEYYSGTDWKAIDAPPVITSLFLLMTQLKQMLHLVE